jgi:GntR family transcriptional regulator
VGVTEPFKFQRRGGLPIYLQLKQKIENLIESGSWKKGQRLPTERDLAKQLGVSRNTVSLAYRQLETEGLITSRQGRGTFVAEADEIVRLENKRERLLQIIDGALKDAFSLGISLEEFLTAVERRVEERRKLLSEVKLALVECNREQLDYFCKELELGTGVKVVPVMIDDLIGRKSESRKSVDEADLIVTTFFHLDELRTLFPERGNDIIGIALDPQIESIVKIARLAPGTEVLLVCLSDRFAERVQKSMDNAGITELKTEIMTERDRKTLEAKLKTKKAVIVSPGRLKEVSSLAKRGTQIIEFIYTLDAGSVNLLSSSVLERKRISREEV